MIRAARDSCWPKPVWLGAPAGHQARLLEHYPEEAALAEALQPMLNAVGFNASVERIDRAGVGPAPEQQGPRKNSSCSSAREAE